MSMYLSLLEASGIHRKTSLGWKFGSPKADSASALRPALACRPGLYFEHPGEPATSLVPL